MKNMYGNIARIIFGIQLVATVLLTLLLVIENDTRSFPIVLFITYILSFILSLAQFLVTNSAYKNFSSKGYLFAIAVFTISFIIEVISIVVASFSGLKLMVMLFAFIMLYLAYRTEKERGR